jgi:hypothetical protein
MICLRYFLWMLVLVVPCLNATALISRTLEKNFPLKEGISPKVHLEVFHGSVLVEVAEGDEFRVNIRQDFEAANDQEADRIAQNLVLGVVCKDGFLDVSAEYSRDIHWSFENWPPVKLSFILKVPKRCALDLYSRDGSVTVNRMAGLMKARTHWGTIFFRGVDGNINAQSEFGDIVVSHCTGDLFLRSISGNFFVGHVGGAADVFGYGGEIEVQSAAGSVKAETSGADLAVGFDHPIGAFATLKTGGANIIMTIDKRSACSFDLKATMFGKVRFYKEGLPLIFSTGAIGKSRVLATLNGGGSKIEARASGGHIYLQAAVDAKP